MFRIVLSSSQKRHRYMQAVLGMLSEGLVLDREGKVKKRRLDGEEASKESATVEKADESASMTPSPSENEGVMEHRPRQCSPEL